MTKTRLWSLGILLIGSTAAIGCVTYGTGYHETVSMGRPAPPAEPAGGSDQPFYDDLSPYGRWVYVSGPGWVWSPNSVQADWRPYQLGHWVFTDSGWTWSSDEQWGWAVYHYGRWNQDPSYGWVWVPGTEWGPAWVAWHEGGGYVGWAPLPWQVRVQAGVNLDWGSLNVTIAPSSWCFVNARHLVDPGLRGRIEPPSRNVTLVQVTKNVTNYTYIDNRVVNNGVRVESIGRAVGHTIPRYRISDADTGETSRGGRVRGDEFVVFRHDPPRGRNSQGRTDPPGHDNARHQEYNRPAEAQPPVPPAPPAGAPSGPPPTAQGQEGQDHGRDSHQSRGRKFLDALTGQQPPPRHEPQGQPPSQPAAPGQPAAPAQPPAPGQPTNAPGRQPDTPSQPSAPAAPPADARAGHPTPGDAHGAANPPGKSAAANAQAAREKAVKDAREAAAKGRKPKQNGPDDDKSKKDKPDSNP